MTRRLRSRQRLLVLAALSASAGLFLSGCASASLESGPAVADTPASTMLADHGLEDLTAAEIIEQLDTLPVAERPDDLLASVQPDALLLSDDRGREAQLPISADEAYLSIAPYETTTHECWFHSLTTCLGELDDAEVQITVTDDSGDVLLEETRRTYDNGFVGVWVPRGTQGTVTIEHDGRSGSTQFSTMGEDDATCLTDLRLV